MNEIYAKYGSGTEDIGAMIEKLAHMKVYFGHQSVGNNILNGIQQWEDETGAKLVKVQSKDFSASANAPLVHFKVGRNGDPHSKIDEFVALVDQIPEDTGAVAMFKFCYVDITDNTDVDLVFGYFKEKMIDLKNNYPNIQFVACTVPLTGIQKGIKAIAKKVLGRNPTGRVGNIKKDQFNKMLINEFEGIMPIFDLGGIESTRPDGSLVTYRYKEIDYPCMPHFYTSDLGHLNDFGSRTVSYNFVAFLAGEFK